MKKINDRIGTGRPAQKSDGPRAGFAVFIKAAGRWGWRFSWRVMSMMLVLTMLINSVSFAIPAEDRAVAEDADAIEEVFSSNVEDDVPEGEGDLDDGDDGSDGLPEKSVLYDLPEAGTVLLSQIFTETLLPARMLDVVKVYVPGDEAQLKEYAKLLVVEPLEDENHFVYDYRITALKFFEDVPLVVYLVNDAYTLLLTHMPRPQEVHEEVPAEPVAETPPETVAELPAEPVVEATPEPVVVTPEPVVVTPEPVAVTPEPVVVTPEPAVVTSEPAIETTPEPVAEDTPAPAIEETPAPAVEVTPVPTVENTPAPVAEDTPAPAIEETPVPMEEDTPEPAAEDTPAPAIEETPAPEADETPDPDAPTPDPEAATPAPEAGEPTEVARTEAPTEMPAETPQAAQTGVASDENGDETAQSPIPGDATPEAEPYDPTLIRLDGGEDTYEDEYVSLAVLGGGAAARLRRTDVETPHYMQAVAAYAVVSHADDEGLSVTLTGLPALEAGEYLALYGVRGGALSESPLADHLAEGDSFAVPTDAWDGFALVRLGLTEYQALSARSVGRTLVEISGELPVEGAVTLEPSVEAGDQDQLLAACDISIQDAVGNDFEPLEDQPLEITLRSDDIRLAQEAGSGLSVEQYVDGLALEGEAEIIEAGGDAVTFAADSCAVYAVREVVLEKDQTASDGRTYRITAAYDSATGIPERAELTVAEIAADTPEYDDYVARSAAQLGEAGERMRLARAFDISFTDPETGAAYPATKDVRVTIEILDADLSDYAFVNVVHFHGGADARPEVLDVVAEGDALAFDTDGFSVFMVYAGSDSAVTVTWQDEDGTVLETDEGVPYGETPVYDGAAPEKAATAQYSYAFAGWDDDVAGVVEDTTFTATYASTLNTYTVTWQDEDGTTLETDADVPYGEEPVYDGATPEKAATAEYTYAFAGWDQDVVPVEGNVSYTAAYEGTVNTYTVTWKNEDDTVLETDADVPYGETPTYGGETPAKESTVDKVYTFVGWDPEVAAVTGDVTYTATFAEATRKYTVSFVNEDGTELTSTEYDYNTPAAQIVRPENPTQAPNAQYTYEFKRWDREFAEVTEDATYTALYTPTLRMYTVRFLGEDGKTDLIEPQTYYYSTAAEEIVQPELPAKEPTAQYTYTPRWEPQVEAVTGDVTYTLVYDQTVNTYTVIWKNYDNTVLKTDTEVPYGAMPEYNGRDPEKAPDAEHPNYSFIGWEPAVAPVEGDATYTAQFTYALVGIHVYDKNSATQQGISGATFTLTNESGVVVWIGTTGANGNLYIEKVDAEPEESIATPGGGAKFDVNSTYTLRQTATDEDHFCPLGYWTLTVGGTADALTFSMTKTKASPLDYSTADPVKFGISFYISNDKASKLYFKYVNPGKTTPDLTDVEKLDFLSNEGTYSLVRENPTDEDNQYEFVGWVDANNEAWKQGDELKLNTLLIKEHNLTSTWRVPLNMRVYTFTAGDITTAALVAGSEGVFALESEKSLPNNLELSLFAKRYDNAEAKTVTESENYDLVQAKISNPNNPDIIVTAVRYESGEHAWQYRDASNAWHNLALNDVLSLYYTTNAVNVVWRKQGANGLEPMEGFPDNRTFNIGSDRWYTANDLFGTEQARYEAVVEGDLYFQYYIIGTDDYTSAEGRLAQGADFQLQNSDHGFRFRPGASGAAQDVPTMTTLCLVYAETPPAGSARMDIENLTSSPFRVRALEAGNADALPTHRVIIETEAGLKLFDGVTDWTPDKHNGFILAEESVAHLVLLDAANLKYTLDGVFENRLESVSCGIGSIAWETVSRLLLSEYQITQTTKGATTGTLDPDTGKTIISFSDLPEATYTVRKGWSDDVDKSIMQVGYAVYEISRDGANAWPSDIPLSDTASEATALDDLRRQGYAVLKLTRKDDNYTIRNSDGWKRTYENLPPQTDRRYIAIETSVKKSSAEVLDHYIRTYESNDPGEIAITNTRDDAICRVGAEEFKTLSAAVAYIESDAYEGTVATIEMLQDYIIPSDDAVTIPAGYDIRLTKAAELSAAKLIRGFAGGDMIAVEGSLTIADLTLDGKVPTNGGRSANNGNGGLVTVKGGATLTVESGTTLQNGEAVDGSAIFAEDGASGEPTRVVFTGGTVRNNYAVTGGAIGVGGPNTSIEFSGMVTVYDNHRTNNGSSQNNVYLSQDTDAIIRVTGAGFAAGAHVGVFAMGDTNNMKDGEPYKEHGRPAKTFATYESTVDTAQLRAFTNDRFNADSPARYGYASTLSDMADKVVWGETFSFTVEIQWLDDDYRARTAPDGASVQLKLNPVGGSTTRGDADNYQSVSAADGWTHTFEGLARYKTNGDPCEYTVTETIDATTAADYAQIVFFGDVGVTANAKAVYKDDAYKNYLVYDAKAADSQKVILSNRMKYTTFTVNKVAKQLPEGMVLTSSFRLMRVPKYGVGSANDLPNGLRSMDAPEAWRHAATMADGDTVSLAASNRFFTLYGGNNWYCQVAPEDGVTGAAMKQGIDSYAASGAGLVKFNSYHDLTVEEGYSDWARGDVKYDGTVYSVYDGSDWHDLSYDGSAQRPDVRIHYTHQDGYEGAEEVGKPYGAEDTSATCTITTVGNDDTKTSVFDVGKKLPSDYIYYAIETSANQKGGVAVSGSDKLIAAYNPIYDYDQANRTVTVTNAWRTVLAVRKEWSGDTNQGICVFDIYKLTGAVSPNPLTNPIYFRELVERGAAANLPGITVTKLDGTFSLRDDNVDGREGSLVHAVTADELGTDYDMNAVYFAREYSVNGLEVEKHGLSVGESPNAVYTYHPDVNLIVVENLGAILCKIVDRDGEHPFRTLKDAYKYGTTRTNGDSTDEFTIEMLRDYNYPNNDELAIAEGKRVTLTTAAKSGGTYNYGGSGTRAIITRGGKAGSFIVVNRSGVASDSTALTLRNIEFNGAGGEVSDNDNGYSKNNEKIGNNGSFVNAKNATITLTGTSMGDGVRMTGGRANGGGAIYGVNSTVSVEYADFDSCVSIQNAENVGGGAIYGNVNISASHSTFKNCTAARCGGAIFQNGGTEITISDCTFDGCRTTQGNQGGGAIHTKATVLNVTDNSSFVDCTSAHLGGAVYANNSTVSVNSATFSACVASNNGGAICAKGQPMTVNHATFTQCKSSVSGGAIYIENGITILASEFYNCTAGSGSSNYGGAVYSKGNTTIGPLNVAEGESVERCVFDGCSAGRGGSLYLDNINELRLNYCDFKNSEANSNEGGGFNHHLNSPGSGNSQTQIDHCYFYNCWSSNTANASGGAFQTDATVLNLTNSIFEDCYTVVKKGGAVQHSLFGVATNTATMTTVTNCEFKNCEDRDTRNVDNQGFGGAMNTDAYTVTVTDCKFTDCSAKFGGAFSNTSNNQQNNGGSLTVSNCIFDNCNTTKYANGKHGGAIYANKAKFDITESSFATCWAGSSGGGIWTNGKQVNVSNVTFGVAEGKTLGCEARNGDGGGLCVDNGAAVVTLVNCQFNKCQSLKNGGGVQSNGTTMTATRCNFTDCEKTGTGSDGGGGISLTKGDGGTVTWLKGCTFTRCISSKAGGGIYTCNRVLKVEKDGDTFPTFTGCKANGGDGGAIRQNKDNTSGTEATLESCTLTDCTASSSGGGVCTNAETVNFIRNSVSNCTAGAAGGGLASLYKDASDKTSTTVIGCSFVVCKSTGSSGGAVYCTSKNLTVEDYGSGDDAKHNSFDNCEAKNSGGAIHHNRGGEAKTELKNCAFSSCFSTSSDGGAVMTVAKTLDMTDCTVTDCHASTWGGGVNHNNAATSTSTTLTGGSFVNCYVSTNEGGGLRSNSRSATVSGVAFTNCHSDGTDGNGGGGFSHGEDNDNGTATLSNCTFTGCYCRDTKNGGAILFRTKQLTVQGTVIDGTISASGVTYNANNGGGIYSSRGEVTIEDLEVDGTVRRSEINNCTAKTSGGGLYQGITNNKPVTIRNTDFTGNTAQSTSGGAIFFFPQNILMLDGCTVSGNRAGSFGGGVYYDSNNNNYNALKQLVMKNGTAITGNSLLNAGVSNGAGVYLRDGSTLVLGSEADDPDEETLTIYYNTASDGEPSNLRMMFQKIDNKQRNMIKNGSKYEPDILLYSDLKLDRSGSRTMGWIGVCTPGEPLTQFGLSDIADRTDMALFVSDDGKMYGKLDDQDTKKIIWYAPPVCQITKDGVLLTYGPDNLAATFTSLADAYTAFNVLTTGYFKDSDGSAVVPNGIEMLVSEYTLTETLPAITREGTFTLTTESTRPTCTITRGESLTGSMFKVAPGTEMNVTNIVLDGGSTHSKAATGGGDPEPLSANENGGIIWANEAASVVLGMGAELKNSITTRDGGAIYLKGGALLELKANSVISNCSANGSGGAIYMGMNATLATTESPTIRDCGAHVSGGAIYASDYALLTLGTTTDVGPTIANNKSDGQGAGIYLYGANSRLNLQGKLDFADNFQQEDIDDTNGDDEYTQRRQDIYLQYNFKEEAPNIVLTNEIAAEKGSIWVYANNEAHYVPRGQFAVTAPDVTITDQTLKAFRNAIEDSIIRNQGTGQYYTGFRGDERTGPGKDGTIQIIWGVLGIDFSFVKIDGFGQKLPGAEFTLYTDAECRTPVTKGDDPLTATSSDGSLESQTGEKIKRGVVLFEKVPLGVYYMKETAVPDGYANATAVDEHGDPIENTYVVLIGSAELEGASASPRTGLWAAGGVLADLTQANVNAQIKVEGETDDRQYAVFLIDPNTGKAVAKPDIAAYGVMNLSEDDRKVILKKIDTGNKPLQGATFEILRFDRSPLASGTDAEVNPITEFTSGENGVYFVGRLPYGIYYLHETGYPDGMQKNGMVGWWYTLTVNDDGVTCSEKADMPPRVEAEEETP